MNHKRLAKSAVLNCSWHSLYRWEIAHPDFVDVEVCRKPGSVLLVVKWT
jgi:hypothetical protein